MIAINAKVLNHFLRRVGSAGFCNPRFLFTPTEKIPRKGHFNDHSNEYKIISVLRRISGEKDFLMVNVHNSMTRTLRNKDPALQRNLQHMV